MKALEEKILKEGRIRDGNILQVDNFLNHQIDAAFLIEMGKEIARLYKDAGVTKVLTIEASGIAIALAAAAEMKVPMLFAKKHKTKNINPNQYKTVVHSFTHGTDYDVVVSRDYLNEDDVVLIVDDFLANGNALKGLIDLTNQAGGTVAGCAIAIEKGFQGGGDALRAEGIRVESMAILDAMEDGHIRFR
ncbi:MAG: xanthine phosphoribosyltransferase [Clostridiales bacterium]|nr:xanthine phosphoribosyltransferase [Clostridiales bacterium]MDD6389574.1 xanthine phosphoribosyltransferase [Bacillota bacterium]MDY5976453.1 xanthine phosphoribosyltransferase [Anaerovoracaceae bacterium]